MGRRGLCERSGYHSGPESRSILSSSNICFPQTSQSSRFPEAVDLRRRTSAQTDDASGVMSCCCQTSQGDTRSIIRRKQLLFCSFPALTSRRVAASWGICHCADPPRRRIRFPRAGAGHLDCRWWWWGAVCGGQACSGHHAADSSDLFLISPRLVSIAHAAAVSSSRDLGAVKGRGAALLIVIPLSRCCLTHLCFADAKPGTFVHLRPVPHPSTPTSVVLDRPGTPLLTCFIFDQFLSDC